MDTIDSKSSHPMRCALAVLEMVQFLHERGYERIRISPGMSPSGNCWRCLITHRGNIQENHGAMPVDFDADSAHYTTGAGSRYFAWEDAHEDRPSELADRFIQRFPEIAKKGQGKDPEYVRWYRKMLELAKEGALPVAYEDWDDEPDPRWLPTTGDGLTKLPMPPV